MGEEAVPGYKGVVRWFDPKKGYGFIESENVDGDIFVHFSEIQMNGFKTLEAEQRVEFSLTESEKGKSAVNVVPE